MKQQYSRPSRTLTLNTHGGLSHLRLEQIVAVRATNDNGISQVDVFTQFHIFTVDCEDEAASKLLASEIHDLMGQ
ncbi:MAG: hypothetical protein GY751_26265 [Bacteroidetes bacterium]|nr:hypothetical protein [Bacteroidota bacterium]